MTAHSRDDFLRVSLSRIGERSIELSDETLQPVGVDALHTLPSAGQVRELQLMCMRMRPQCVLRRACSSKQSDRVGEPVALHCIECH